MHNVILPSINSVLFPTQKNDTDWEKKKTFKQQPDGSIEPHHVWERKSARTVLDGQLKLRHKTTLARTVLDIQNNRDANQILKNLKQSHSAFADLNIQQQAAILDFAVQIKNIPHHPEQEQETDALINTLAGNSANLPADTQWKLHCYTEFSHWKQDFQALNEKANASQIRDPDTEAHLQSFVVRTENLLKRTDSFPAFIGQNMVWQIHNSTMRHQWPEILQPNKPEKFPWRSVTQFWPYPMTGKLDPNHTLATHNDFNAQLQIERANVANGNYGYVSFARGVSGSTYAIKTFMRDDDTYLAEMAPYQAAHEYEQRTGEKIDIIPKMYGVYQADGQSAKIVAMEKVEGQTLVQFQRNVIDQYRRNQISHTEATGMLQNISLQIFQGIEQLKKINYIHGDLKGENMIVTPEGKVKFLDLGNAQVIGTRRKSEITTAYHADTATLNPAIHTPKDYADNTIQRVLQEYECKPSIDQYSAASITLWLMETLQSPHAMPAGEYILHPDASGALNVAFPRAAVNNLHTPPTAQEANKYVSSSIKFLRAHTRDEVNNPGLERPELELFMDYALGRKQIDDTNIDPVVKKDIQEAANFFFDKMPAAENENAHAAIASLYEKIKLDELRRQRQEPLPTMRKPSTIGNARDEADDILQAIIPDRPSVASPAFFAKRLDERMKQEIAAGTSIFPTQKKQTTHQIAPKVTVQQTPLVTVESVPFGNGQTNGVPPSIDDIKNALQNSVTLSERLKKVETTTRQAAQAEQDYQSRKRFFVNSKNPLHLLTRHNKHADVKKTNQAFTQLLDTNPHLSASDVVATFDSQAATDQHEQLMKAKQACRDALFEYQYTLGEIDSIEQQFTPEHLNQLKQKYISNDAIAAGISNVNISPIERRWVTMKTRLPETQTALIKQQKELGEAISGVTNLFAGIRLM